MTNTKHWSMWHGLHPDFLPSLSRRRLPSGFVHEAHHIISLVGDQSAGKSYFLAVLSKMLPAALFAHFRIVMQDADPTANAALNELRKTLFAAATPEEIRVNKTVMEGAMYERLPRQGRTVALPRPFIYTWVRPITQRLETR